MLATTMVEDRRHELSRNDSAALLLRDKRQIVHTVFIRLKSQIIVQEAGNSHGLYPRLRLVRTEHFDLAQHDHANTDTTPRQGGHLFGLSGILHSRLIHCDKDDSCDGYPTFRGMGCVACQLAVTLIIGAVHLLPYHSEF